MPTVWQAGQDGTARLRAGRQSESAPGDGPVVKTDIEQMITQVTLSLMPGGRTRMPRGRR